MTGNEFKQWRLRQNYHKSWIAAQLNITPTTIYNWENLPELPKLTRLALSALHHKTPLI
jgi:DNA-binding XRE family transcriptional regulator